MHLVIFSYHECLFCHTQRQSPHAVQQHMMGKGHCRFSLEAEDSDDEENERNEFRDFYEPVTDNENGPSEGEDQDALSDCEPGNDIKRSADGTQQPTRNLPSKLKDSTIRLSTGKIVSSRSATAPKTRHHPLLGLKSRGGGDSLLESLLPTTSPPDTIDTRTPAHEHTPSSSQTQAISLTRAERRILTGHRNSTLSTAIARMSLRDRSALAHLSPAEQRATVIRQFKQQDRMQAADRRYRGEFANRND